MHFAYMVPFGSKASSLESKIHGITGGDKPNPKYPDRKLRPNRPVDVVSAFDCAR